MADLAKLDGARLKTKKKLNVGGDTRYRKVALVDGVVELDGGNFAKKRMIPSMLHTLLELLEMFIIHPSITPHSTTFLFIQCLLFFQIRYRIYSFRCYRGRHEQNNYKVRLLVSECDSKLVDIALEVELIIKATLGI